MEFFVPTRSGRKGPFGPEALAKLLEEGKVPAGIQVTCADSGSRVPLEEAIGCVALQRPAAMSKRTAFGLSALILFILLAAAIQVGGLAHDAAGLFAGAAVAAAVLVLVAAGLAAPIDSALGGKRFAKILLASSAALGIVMFFLAVTVWKKQAPPPPPPPPEPIAFKAGRFEITPGAAWRPVEEKTNAKLDLEIWWPMTRTRLGVTVNEMKGAEKLIGDAIADPAARGRFNSNPLLQQALGTTNLKIAWGPDPIPGSRLPGVWEGVSWAGQHASTKGIIAYLAGKDALLGVMVLGPEQYHEGQRHEIDAMIASIREKS
jgi:hypothetical protein